MDIIYEIIGQKSNKTKKTLKPPDLKLPTKTPKPSDLKLPTKTPKPSDLKLPTKTPEHVFKLHPFQVKRISTRKRALSRMHKSMPESLSFNPPNANIIILKPKPTQKEEYTPKRLKKFELSKIPKKPLSETILEITLKLKDYTLPVTPSELPRENPRVHFEEPREKLRVHFAEKKEESRVIERSPSPRRYKIPRFIRPDRNTNSSVYANIDIFDVCYNTPKTTDIAVMLVFFDYVGSARILMNYLYMVEKLKLANIPVFTLELVINGKQPKIKDAFHVYGSSFLFQKEHLLRLLETYIPPEFTKLACLDADIIFDNPDWYDILSEALEMHDVIQSFKEAFWLNLDYTEVQLTAQSVCNYNPELGRNFFTSGLVKFHTGFGWCFRREWYNKVGYYDLAVIGSGDTVFSHALFNFTQIPKSQEFNLYLQTLYTWWEKNTCEVRFSTLNTNVYHMYHGSINNRQYYDRYKPFKEYTNIEDIISKNENDVYELIVPELNEHMFNFFKTRNDDGID